MLESVLILSIINVFRILEIRGLCCPCLCLDLQTGICGESLSAVYHGPKQWLLLADPSLKRAIEKVTLLHPLTLFVFYMHAEKQKSLKNSLQGEKDLIKVDWLVWQNK